MSDVYIDVPLPMRDRLWEQTPDGYWGVSAMLFRPQCSPGEVVRFCYEGVVAEAMVARVVPPKPGQNGWLVLWNPNAFRDLRIPEQEWSMA